MSATSHRNIPACSRVEANGSATGVVTLGDVVENLRVCVGYRVDEANRAFADSVASLVDQSEDRAKRRGGGRCAKDLRPFAVDGGDVVGSVGRDIWEPSGGLRVVVPVCAVRWQVVLEERLDRAGLVIWEREYVAEATARINDRLTSLLRLSRSRQDVRSVDDLCGTNARHERTCSRE